MIQADLAIRNAGDGRTVAVRKVFRWTVTDFDDLHQGQRSDRGCLRVLYPFFHRANHAPGAVGGDYGLL